MKKVYLLKGLDCPGCSAKIEKEVGELDGITSSSVNLMKQTITVEFDANADVIFSQIEKIVHSHEPDVSVSEYHSGGHSHEHGHTHEHDHEEGVHMMLRLICGAVIFLAGAILPALTGVPNTVGLVLLGVSYIILGGDVLWNAVRNITKGHVFDENFLMSIASIGAFLIGESHEAVGVMLFYQVGEYFQHLAVDRSRRSIGALLDIRPDSAAVMRHGETAIVSPDEVAVGETIVIKPGEKVPLDGAVTDGESMLDTTALTGESVPRRVRPGDEILSGCINQSGVLTVKVTKNYGQSTASKIIDMVEHAQARKAPSEQFITKFAAYYTPVVVITAALLAVFPPLLAGGEWAEWIRRALVFLVISCPCALVISVPLTFFGGIGAASRHGVLVKGGNYLEALNSVDTVVFDKTGTLTYGSFKVTEIITENGFTASEVLEYAALAESCSNHPIAKSILSSYGKDISSSDVSGCTEVSGRGVTAVCGGKTVLAGNKTLLESNGVAPTLCDTVGTKVYVAVDGIYAGCILICDEIKEGCAAAVAKLKAVGIKQTVMLTGDDEKIAASVAEELGINEYHAELLPGDKVTHLEEILSRKRSGKTAFVGDGINDAPVLARADVGIAMGALGSDAAIEAADVVLMTDEVSKLSEAIETARHTKRIVIQNIVIALGIKGFFLVLGALGIANMWTAVFGDVGVALIAVFNAMRIMKK